MRTIRTKVYKFEELTPEAKEVALEQARNNIYIELDMFEESAVEKIQEKGFFDNVSVRYSLSSSQGDGLSFSADRFESDKLLAIFLEVLGKDKEKSAKVIMNRTEFNCITNVGRYAYASRSDVDFQLDYVSYNNVRIDEVIEKVQEKLRDLYMELCKELEKEGYEEIEHQYKDETLKTEFENNNIEFLANGNKYNL